MSAIPGDIETDSQPPMTIPLRHFVVALGFLVGGGAVGALAGIGALPGPATLAHVHLLLAGWVCVTIMGAMTQFVPVWSNVALHSRRLATAQLWLVTAGLAGFAASLLAGRFGWLHAFGGLLLLGFWIFVYNIGRTLAAARPFDVTERHFALALGYFLALTPLGLLLALDYATPVFAGLPVARADVVAAHATLAVFGAVLTTVFGALYQLATMFTQTELHGPDVVLRRFEEVGYPAGVVALALGRLVGFAPLARVGGLLVVLSVAAVAVILARRLVETRVAWTPMLSRYAVAATGMGLWAVLAAPSLVRDPLAPAARFGGPGLVHLLVFGAIGFVVLGTLYHVVPFIIWVHRYSDRLGFEAVPMIDDLYDDRLASADFAAVTAGAVGLVAADLLPVPEPVGPVAGALATLGFALFAANLLLVVHRHSPHSFRGVLVSRLAGDPDLENAGGEPPAEATD